MAEVVNAPYRLLEAGSAGNAAHVRQSNPALNRNGASAVEHENDLPHNAPHYYGGSTSNSPLSKTLTPGGHLADDDLIAIGNAHRKIANPLPLGVFGFSSATLLLSLYNAGTQGITIPNAIVGFALAYGGLAQYLAGLWEFASGNTFGATVFCSFGMFWWGYSMILIPWFGFQGTSNGQPGIYAPGSPYAAESSSAIGMFLWVWFAITTIYLITSLRGSVALFVLIFFLWMTFIMLGANSYTGNPSLLTAGGAFGIATGLTGYYLGTASLLSRTNSYFTLPVISLAKKE